MYKNGILKSHQTPYFKVFGECLGLFHLILVIRPFPFYSSGITFQKKIKS